MSGRPTFLVWVLGTRGLEAQVVHGEIVPSLAARVVHKAEVKPEDAGLTLALLARLYPLPSGVA